MPRRAKAKSEPDKIVKKRAKRTNGFARLVSQERKRLQKVHDSVLARKAAIDRELEAIQRDLTAMGSFFSQSGKRAGFRPERAGRGQRRQQVLDAIKSFADGATRGDIIKKLNAAEKNAQQSISNSLNALFKSKAVKRENGRYHAS
jgi:hypothetical protein